MQKEGEEIPISVLAIEQREEMLWICSEPIAVDKFPPCIKNIIQDKSSNEGQYRKAAILAAFLGQAGWEEVEAKVMWSETTGVEERIFCEWFSKLHCPKCETLKRHSRGYPDLGIGDLGLCRPDDLCQQFAGPVEYAAEVRSDEDRKRGRLHHIKTLERARVFDWVSGREMTIDLNQAERKELEERLAELQQDSSMVIVYSRIKLRGRLRPRFFIRERDGPARRILSELM